MTKNEFHTTILSFADKLYKIAYRMLENKEAAKDILQETFYKLWEKNESLIHLSSIEAFAVTITKNLCLDFIKLKKKTFDIQVLAKHTENQPDFDKNESCEHIKKIILTLPEQQRLIVQMHDIDGLTYEEIEIILGISVNNIRVSISIARKKIRDELSKIYDYGIKQC